MTGPAPGLRPAEILLEILETLDDPHRRSDTLPQARLAAAEGLTARAAYLSADHRARLVRGIAQILRDTVLPLHRVRAAALLLQLEAGEATAGGARAEATP